MQDVMGIINLSEKEDAIKEITYNRPIGAVPMAGRYRVIDFVLSNMVNAGIQNVSIFTHGRSSSLVEHLGTGKEWDLDRKIDGLFIFNPVINGLGQVMPRGDIKNFRDHIDYIKRSKQRYVILTKSFMICNINYLDVIRYHKKSNGDITIVYKKIKEDDNERFLQSDTLNLDENKNVISIGKNIGNEDSQNISLEMYIMKKSLLLQIVESSISKGDALYLKDAILQNMKNLSVKGYEFNGYLGCINSIENYYRVNMELLDMEKSHELFYKNGYIYTKIKDEAPTKYSEKAQVSNAIVANGCIIEGTVENSVIARGVKIKNNATVKDCVIMQKCVIEEGAFLKHIILDKNVQISKNKILRGDSKKPMAIMKNMKL